MKWTDLSSLSDPSVRHAYRIRWRLLHIRNPNLTGRQWVDMMAELRWELQLVRDEIHRRGLTVPASKKVRVKKVVKPHEFKSKIAFLWDIKRSYLEPPSPLAAAIPA